ncbi:MAG: glycosyl hydrolase family 65 protein [Lachnospiraceae bacterium]|nr:glycosyl hydrolase family 65 protein [Lachnospiraceae bacterium]
MDWKIRTSDRDVERISTRGNRFLVGNGYLGIRGTLEEYRKEQLPAVNLAGIFDQVGDSWREPLNAPNGLYTYVKVDGEAYGLPGQEPLEHEMVLDYRNALFSRKTSWKTGRGVVTVISERFASRAEVHLIGMKYTVTADFHADVELYTGIDGNVWEINGPHYRQMEAQVLENRAEITAITQEKGDTVTVMEAVCADFPHGSEGSWRNKEALHKYEFVTEPGRAYQIRKGIVVFTSKDAGWSKERAGQVLEEFSDSGYEAEKQKHRQAWEEKWRYGQVLVEGDDQAMEALNYSLYHLLSIAPAHAKSMSIPARGLSGQTYKGAVFWDTEMFMLDYFLFTDPAVARTLMKYRVDTLGGAKQKAAQYGWEGAYYAWESQEGGYDACTDYNVVDVFTGRPMRTFFRDKQYHISAAIVYGIMRYSHITGDDSLLKEGGLETVIECARFYYSLLLKRAGGTRYEIHDVIGPDEYHERVNNNAYTNRMAKYTFQMAVELLTGLDRFGDRVKESIEQQYRVPKLLEQFEDAAEHLYVPAPDEQGIIEQFDGYGNLEDVFVDQVRSRLLHEKEYWGGAYGVASQTKVIKQADVVTMLNLFSDEYPEDICLKNWKYYEPRTEHGSSLSACMYAMLACKCGMPREAYPFFVKSARADLNDGGKEWAGLIYIGGTHPAASGGAYMTAVEGFGGVSFTEGKLKVKPQLPENWKRMKFHICCGGKRYAVDIRPEETTVEEVEE